VSSTVLLVGLLVAVGSPRPCSAGFELMWGLPHAGQDTAFSPTDTMHLTRWAKMIMLLQSAISLVTVALVVARAVNILK